MIFVYFYFQLIARLRRPRVWVDALANIAIFRQDAMVNARSARIAYEGGGTH